MILIVYINFCKICSGGVMSAGAAQLTKKQQKKTKNRLNGCTITQCIAVLRRTDQKFDDQFYTFLIFKRRHIHKNIKTSRCNKLNAL